MSEKATYPAIEGLRVIVPLAILLNHWSDGLYDRLLPQGQLAIDYFFATEGFLAAGVFARKQATPRRYFWNRLVTLYPVYCIALLVGAYLVWSFQIASHFTWTSTSVFNALLPNVFLLPAMDAPSPLVAPFNWPTWAILCEMYVLFLYAVGHRMLADWKRSAALCAFCGVIYCAMAISANSPNLGYLVENYWGGLPRCIFGFLLGTLLYALSQRMTMPRVPAILVWAIAIAFMFLKVKYVGLFLFLFGTPLIILAAAGATAPAWLTRGSLALGRLALWTYLIHFPILVASHVVAAEMDITSDQMASPWYFLALVAATLMVAACIHYIRRFQWPFRRALATD
jgi:hypothetical protein